MAKHVTPHTPPLWSAERYLKLGWPVIALHNPRTGGGCSCGDSACTNTGKHPRYHAEDLAHGPHSGTLDPEVLEVWKKRWPAANVGIQCGKAAGIWVLDVDGPEGVATLKRLIKEYGGQFPKTPRQQTGRKEGGFQFFFEWAPGLPNHVGFAPGLDTRTDGGLVVAPPSVHATGKVYQWLKDEAPEDLPLAAAPEWLLSMSRAAKAKETKEQRALTPPGAPLPLHTRNDRLFREGCALVHHGAIDETIRIALAAENQARCDPALLPEEVEKITQSVFRYRERSNRLPVFPARQPGGTSDHLPPASGHRPPPLAETPAGSVPFSPQNAPSFASLASLQENASRPHGGLSLAQEAKALAPSGRNGSGPALFALAPEAYYGLPGMAVELILPHTEAHPAALLANFLTAVGCLIGPGPYAYRDGRRQGVNEFACVVGLSAASRKGTATSRIEEVVKHAFGTEDASQYDIFDHVTHARAPWEKLTLRGLGSGEALVSSLAASAATGERDSRRFVCEEEFSRCLKVMSREGSILSEMLRATWDGSRLENRVKGKTLSAPPGHVAMMGHITEMELRAQLGEVALFNGFANRFLWFLAERSKFLPLGGGRAPTAPVVVRLRAALEREVAREIDFDARVRALWDEGGLYEQLETRPPGLLGAVTARGAAHVTRLSLLWAVLDGDTEIRVPHLMAALAVWDYNERSCAYLFGESTGDEYADAILVFLEDVAPGYLTRTDFWLRFKGHADAGRLNRALLMLERAGKIARGELPTAGRTAHCWTLKEGGDAAREAVPSVLQRARSLL